MKSVSPPAESGSTVSASRRLPAGARREQLLDVAARLLQTGGVEALTMEALGKQAGASKTLGYAYFDNVEHVLVALRHRELAELYRRVEQAAVPATTFDERVTSAMHAYFDIVEERGLRLYQLEQLVNARHLDVDESAETNGFLHWLSVRIADEFQVDQVWALACAALIGHNANAHAGIWMATGYSRDTVEQFAVRFILGGIRAAVTAELGASRASS